MRLTCIAHGQFVSQVPSAGHTGLFTHPEWRGSPQDCSRKITSPQKEELPQGIPADAHVIFKTDVVLKSCAGLEAKSQQIE